MFHKGLNSEQIALSAKGLIEENGYDSFSMRLLAERLGIKTASLYAHFESMDALLSKVGILALTEQKDKQLHAIEGKKRDEAVMSLAKEYRSYAKEHRELYRFIMKMPLSNDEVLKEGAAVIAEPEMKVLNDYRLSDTQKMHWQRVMRGMMHGFISEEENGYFSHYPVEVEESYRIAVNCLIEGLHEAEEENHAA